MLPFIKKRSGESSVKPMSEEDIQRKLYGSYRSGSRVIVHQDESDIIVDASAETVPEVQEEELFDDVVTDEEAEGAVQFEAPPDGELFTLHDEKKHQLHTSPLEMDETIWEEKKTSDVMSASLSDTPLSMPHPLSKPARYRDNAWQDFWDSFKLDLAELKDKLRSISPRAIFITAASIALILIVFNIWTRAHRGSSFDMVPAATSPAVVPAVVRTAAQTVPEPRRTPAQNAAAVAPTHVPARTSAEPAHTPETPFVQDAPVTSVKKQLSAFHTVQICTYKDVERAEQLVGTFQKNDLDSFYRKVTTGSGSVFYIVYIGQFKDLKAAENFFQRFRKTDTYKQFPDSFIKYVK